MTIYLIDLDRPEYTPEFKEGYSNYVSMLQEMHLNFITYCEGKQIIDSRKILASAVSKIEPTLEKYFECSITGEKRKPNAWNKERKRKRGGRYLYRERDLITSYNYVHCTNKY